MIREIVVNGRGVPVDTVQIAFAGASDFVTLVQCDHASPPFVPTAYGR